MADHEAMCRKFLAEDRSPNEEFGVDTIDALVTRVDTLVADNARLRGLVKGVEQVFDGDCSFICPWCEQGYANSCAQKITHATACPAFTPDGVVR